MIEKKYKVNIMMVKKVPLQGKIEFGEVGVYIYNDS